MKAFSHANKRVGENFKIPNAEGENYFFLGIFQGRLLCNTCACSWREFSRVPFFPSRQSLKVKFGDVISLLLFLPSTHNLFPRKTFGAAARGRSTSFFVVFFFSQICEFLRVGSDFLLPPSSQVWGVDSFKKKKKCHDDNGCFFFLFRLSWKSFFFSGYFSLSFPIGCHTCLCRKKAKQNSFRCFFSMQQKYEKCHTRSPFPHLRPYIHFPLINPQQLSLSPIRFFMLSPLSLSPYSSSYDLQPLSIPPRTRHACSIPFSTLHAKKERDGVHFTCSLLPFSFCVENIKTKNKLNARFPLFQER